jgi:hypothetical protein
MHFNGVGRFDQCPDRSKPISLVSLSLVFENLLKCDGFAAGNQVHVAAERTFSVNCR